MIRIDDVLLGVIINVDKHMMASSILRGKWGRCWFGNRKDFLVRRYNGWEEKEGIEEAVYRLLRKLNFIENINSAFFGLFGTKVEVVCKGAELVSLILMAIGGVSDLSVHTIEKS